MTVRLDELTDPQQRALSLANLTGSTSALGTGRNELRARWQTLKALQRRGVIDTITMSWSRSEIGHLTDLGVRLAKQAQARRRRDRH